MSEDLLETPATRLGYARGHALASVLIARDAPRLPWPVTGGPQGDLPDINVWLALLVREHPFHQRALSYWADTTAGGGAHPRPCIWFCRATMLGLVRLLADPRVVGKGALTLKEAFAAYLRLSKMPAVGMLAEPASCEAHLQSLLAGDNVPAGQLADTWLAAVNFATGLRLVTFDPEFERFQLQNWLVLPRG